MSPRDYKNRYLNLKVTLENGNSKTVSVRRYLMKSLGYAPQGNNEFMHALRKHGMNMTLHVNTATGVTIVDRKLNKPEQKFRKKSHMDVALSLDNGNGVETISTEGERIITDKTGGKIVKRIHAERDWGAMTHYAFLGKGSPEVCQVVLQLAHHWGLTDEEGLPSYAEKWLGLDCNGFVGNYLWHVRKGHPWTDIGVYNWETGPDALISGYFSGKKRLQSWDEMKPGTIYIMGKANKDGVVVKGGGGVATAGHIVMTVPNDRIRSGQTFSQAVVESTYGHSPDGLTDGYYSFKEMNGKAMKLNRGTGMKAGHEEIDMVITEL